MGVKNITSPSAYDLLANLKYLATPTQEELQLLEIHKQEIPIILQNLKMLQNENTEKENKMTKEIKTKKCSKCGTVKPITEFYKCNRTSDGYGYLCKVCHNSYNKKSRNQAKSPNNNFFKDYLKIKIQSAKDLMTKLQTKIETYQEILEEI